MQKVICEDGIYDFQKALQEAFGEGYKIVPHTLQQWQRASPHLFHYVAIVEKENSKKD